jgi:Flp pilus assembly pilin Flp
MESDPTGANDENGSLVTEYGLLAVVAATIAAVLVQWATNGAIVNLFNALIDRTRGLIGA